MFEKKKKELILSLIKDDLIYKKRIARLKAAGLLVNNYGVDIADVVFDFMELKDNKQNEKIYQGYITLIKKADEINNSISNDAFNPLVNEIYNYLIRIQPINKKKSGK